MKLKPKGKGDVFKQEDEHSNVEKDLPERLYE
jgi:hypothetical protein